MLATLKRHSLLRPILLTLMLILVGAAGLSRPAHADPTQDCLDACDAIYADCVNSCPTGLHSGRQICLIMCRSNYSYCISTC
jgi:hypothetical protein